MKNKFKTPKYIITVIGLIFLLVIISRSYKNIPASTKIQSYCVGQGETLWSIGSQYSGNNDVREWIYETEKLNKMDSPDIYIGEKLKVEDWR